MVFPEEAVYGTTQRFDGRDDTSSAPQTPTSTNSDDYEDLVHIASRDEEGNPCAEIEVTRAIFTKRSLTLTATASSMVDRHLHIEIGRAHV